MNCLRPIAVPRFKCDYKTFRKILALHDIDPVDIPYLRKVPCGKCAACKLTQGRKWTLRLLETMNKSFNNFFVTLTYTDEELIALNFDRGKDAIPQLNKEHLRNFLTKMKNSLRAASEQQMRAKGMDTKTAHKISVYPSYYAIGDYGEITLRPHYHVILFNCPIDAQDLYNRLYDWFGFGFIHDVRPLSAAHCSYVVKYLTALSPSTDFAIKNNLQPPFYISSRHLMPTPQRILNLADEMDNGYRYIQHGVAKYGIPAYLKGKIQRKRQTDDNRLYEVYSELVKDATNYVGFLEENERLKIEPLNLAEFTDAQKHYNEFIINRKIRQS